MKQLSIAGCGWLGLALAQHLTAKSWQISGCSRNLETLTTLKQHGIAATYMDLDGEFRCPEPSTLFASEWLFINVPPGRHQQDNAYADRVALLAQAAKSHGVNKVIFVSSTAVYQDGADYPNVNEQSALASDVRAATMLEAEAVIKQHFEQWMILRPAGLVGGERHPGRFLAGKVGLAGAGAPINLVHRDDVIAAVEMLLEQPQWGEIFNLSAPKTCNRGEFYPQAAQALGLTAPSFSDELQNGKKVDSSKICRAGFEFCYPNVMTMPPLAN
ncbi:SDR family oxidoreductase [Ferrimonas lipolytica]|uniref:SDR family oxidoreductase n=1 Tax=Ferrimonas lipolytica TaxID=2724191 RepID=A0A6H1UDF2_9GAMM|nr:SDR family oxidoreductase [Ferrimonas lipolytica]QIZ76868.1 SDR family oxidoreductase [Ferrimonas lipolytica]